MKDSEFLSQFENYTLRPQLFTHKAHLRLAWLYISLYGVEKAIENCCVQISGFASFHGDDQKFNKTITTAAVYAVHHFMNDEHTFDEFIRNNPRLLSDLKALINSHYSYDIFDVAKAREVFIEPDIQAFV